MAAIPDNTGDRRKTQNIMCDYIQSNLASCNYKKYNIIKCNATQTLKNNKGSCC